MTIEDSFSYICIADLWKHFLQMPKTLVYLQLIVVTNLLPFEAWCNMEADVYSVNLQVSHL
jgi:hypothetical protein